MKMLIMKKINLFIEINYRSDQSNLTDRLTSKKGEPINIEWDYISKMQKKMNPHQKFTWIIAPCLSIFIWWNMEKNSIWWSDIGNSEFVFGIWSFKLYFWQKETKNDYK